MDERSFQRLLRRTVAIPVALLGVLAIILAFEILTLTQSLRMVDHTDQVIANARQAMRYMADMESSTRGFELTGDEKFLEIFRNAESQLPASIDALAETDQRQPTATVSRSGRPSGSTRTGLDWAEHEIATHAKKRPTEAELLQGDFLMEQIRKRQREIVGEEEGLLQLRTRKATNWSHVTLLTAVGLSIMVAGLLFTLTRRELRQLASTYEQHSERGRGEKPATGGKPRAFSDHSQQPWRRGNRDRRRRQRSLHQSGGAATHGLDRLPGGPRPPLARSRPPPRRKDWQRPHRSQSRWCESRAGSSASRTPCCSSAGRARNIPLK